MKITPQDIYHKEFKRGLRGYSEEEVDVFLDKIAEQFEELYKKNKNLDEELHQLKEKLKKYHDMELTLQNTLMTAQKSAEEVQMSAKKEADLVVNNAKIEAKNTLSKIEKQKQVLYENITKLKRVEGDVKAKIRANLDSLVKRLDRIEADETQSFEEIEQQIASMPEVEIPKVANVPAIVEPSQKSPELKKEKVKVETPADDTANSGDGKADAAKSDIASEAEIDKFLKQEVSLVLDKDDAAEEKKGTLLGRFFKRSEQPMADDGNGEKFKIKNSKKPGPKKAKNRKKKNTEEIA